MSEELPISVLKELRLKKGWTQQYVADSTYVTVKTYREWEKGKNTPQGVHLLRLAELFETSVDYISGISEYTQIGNKEICEITGLSNESIEEVRNNHFVADKEVLNELLCSDSFWKFVSRIAYLKGTIDNCKGFESKKEYPAMSMCLTTVKASYLAVTEMLSRMVDELYGYNNYIDECETLFRKWKLEHKDVFTSEIEEKLRRND